MVFLKLLLLSIGLLSIAMLGFSLKILVKRKGSFPETRIGHNEEMRKRKIYCIKTEQVRIDKGIDIKAKHTTNNCAGCV